MAIPRPLILDNAGLTLDGKELACVLNHIELNPDVTVVTLTTMCGEVDYPASTKWTLVATLYQSFDPDATEEVLSAAVEANVPVPFELIPRRDDPVSATNPMWSGELIPQPYSPVNGDAGGESTVELEWALTAAPVKSTAAAVVATGATAGTPGQFTPAGAAAPADLAAMAGLTALPATAWTTGQHVITADTQHCHWDGAAWASGDAA